MTAANGAQRAESDAAGGANGGAAAGPAAESAAANRAGAARARVLLTVDQLAAQLSGESQEAPVLLDVRWTLTHPDGRADFEAGHIPGARYVNLSVELADHANKDPARGRHPLPSVEEFEQTVRSWGVGAQTPVVVYDDAGGQAAARAWWMLRWVGHEDVHVLDGGWSAWRGAGLPIETGAADGPVAEPATLFVAVQGSMRELSADDAAALAASSDGVLLDARAPERYAGETEPLDPQAGHIPGARSAPAGGNTEAGSFKTTADLTDYYRPLGAIASDGQDASLVGAYCGSGVSASHTVLALASLGVDAALFPGSWSAWSNDPSRPVATGADPAH